MKKFMLLVLASVFLAASSSLALPDAKDSKFYSQKKAGKLNRPHPKFKFGATDKSGKPNPWTKYKKKKQKK